MNNIKLSVIDCQYYFNEKKGTVTCKLFYRLKMDDIWENLFSCVLSEFPHCSQSVVATAYLADGDTFDRKKGMQVARAKAESRAYKEMIPVMDNLITFVRSTIGPAIKFIDKASNTIIHNDEYLSTF